jgi:hypothetical protein
MRLTCAYLMQTLLILMTGRHPAKRTNKSDQHVQVSTDEVQQYEPGIGWQGCIVAGFGQACVRACASAAVSKQTVLYLVLILCCVYN